MEKIFNVEILFLLLSQHWCKRGSKGLLFKEKKKIMSIGSLAIFFEISASFHVL